MISAEELLPIGRRIDSASEEKYRPLQWIGRGGNCHVFLGIALSGPRKGLLFAIKIFTRLDKPERHAQFLDESEFLQKCDHPAVMRVYDRGNLRKPIDGSVTEYPFAIADYYPSTLAEAQRARLPLPTKVIYILQLLSAIKYLGSIEPQVVHRDIKPENIFIRGFDCALGDFGLMKRLHDDQSFEDDGEEIFKASALPGMPKYYRTPDLVAYGRQERQLTTASDVFQLGLVAAGLFCGNSPLIQTNNLLNPVELKELGPVAGSLGDAIRDAIGGMLVIETSDRTTVAELLDQWEGILNQVSTQYHHLEGRVF